jgi:hypothetical protein
MYALFVMLSINIIRQNCSRFNPHAGLPRAVAKSRELSLRAVLAKQSPIRQARFLTPFEMTDAVSTYFATTVGLTIPGDALANACS